MGYMLTGDQLRFANRKLGEIERQLGQDVGYPYDPNRLLGALQAIVEGRFGTVGGQFFPSMLHASELIPRVWTVIEDVPPSDFQIKDLEFVGFLRGNETRIGGGKMRRRAVELRGNLGLSDGKRMLAEQEKIPVRVRGKSILLSGTVLSGPGGLRIPLLFFVDSGWMLGFRFVDSDVDDSCCLARLKSANKP